MQRPLFASRTESDQHEPAHRIRRTPLAIRWLAPTKDPMHGSAVARQMCSKQAMLRREVEGIVEIRASLSQLRYPALVLQRTQAPTDTVTFIAVSGLPDGSNDGALDMIQSQPPNTAPQLTKYKPPTSRAATPETGASGPHRGMRACAEAGSCRTSSLPLAVDPLLRDMMQIRSTT
ncbi:hypothetical protein DL765_003672 [Monosporascus sp. GIB2]|nr:hypothetical protein DL765_003672 [Monosporascus sp. GIB2]